jgi:hypothetical protein
LVRTSSNDEIIKSQYTFVSETRIKVLQLQRYVPLYGWFPMSTIYYLDIDINDKELRIRQWNLSEDLVLKRR